MLKLLELVKLLFGECSVSSMSIAGRLPST